MTINVFDIIIGTILILIIILAIILLKKEKNCCSGCGGNCSNCSKRI